MVEFALAATVLLLVFFGVIEVGRVFETSVALDNAVRAGAAYGASSVSKRLDTSGITQVTRQAAPRLGSFSVQVSVVCGCPNGDEGNCPSLSCLGSHKYVSVAATVTLTSITSYIALPESFTLRSRARMRIAQ